ncbi:MAG: hypothetical protein V3V41_04885, partial [Candidatus Heimdallarchaeota archaeon]
MVKRPKDEYLLENECEKKIMELPNGAKVRILFVPSENKTKESMNIIFYSGFISYIYLWKDSIKLLRKNHSVIFIESREKEFSAFPPNEVIYDIDALGKDFTLIVEELKIDLQKSVFTGSSIASVAVLEAMSENDFQPFLSIHSSPQAYYEANNKTKILATYFPYWFV